MVKTRSTVVSISLPLKIFLGVCFLFIASAVGILIAMIVVAVQTENKAETILSKEAITELLVGALAEINLPAIISAEMSNPVLLANIQQAIVTALTGGARSQSLLTRTPEPSCPQITDRELCFKMDDMCSQLHKCVNTANVTECWNFGFRAQEACLYQSL
jgi:hypothetical protein